MTKQLRIGPVTIIEVSYFDGYFLISLFGYKKPVETVGGLLCYEYVNGYSGIIKRRCTHLRFFGLNFVSERNV